jgi:hypothetical protein
MKMESRRFYTLINYITKEFRFHIKTRFTWKFRNGSYIRKETEKETNKEEMPNEEEYSTIEYIEDATGELKMK